MGEVSIHDAAAYILERYPTGVSTMKLQKLCYLAQGWNLALRRQPLFDEDFEAWARGPVSRALFGRHRSEYSVSSWSAGDAERLDPQERIVIDAMLRNYGALTGLELSELTHKSGTPWSETRRRAGVEEGGRSDSIVTKAEIEKHFLRLVPTGVAR